MNRSAILILLLLFAAKLYSQDQGCFELQIREVFHSRGYDFLGYPKKYNSRSACQEAMNKINTGRDGSKEVIIVKGCTTCEKKSSENSLPQSDPTTTPANHSNKQSSNKYKQPSTSSSGNCQSRAKNKQILKNRQSQIGDSNRANRMFFDNALNLIDKVDCGVYLKTVDCVNNNCTLEWSSENEEISTHQAREAVNKFNEELKEKVREQEQKEEFYKQMAESLLLLIDALENRGKKGEINLDYDVATEERLGQALLKENLSIQDISGNQVDENNDGKIDYVVIESSNIAKKFQDINGDGYTDLITLTYKDESGGQQLLMDINNDGSIDKIVDVFPDGYTNYRDVNHSNLEVGKNLDISSVHLNEDDWNAWRNSMKINPGEDGFLTTVRPDGENSPQNELNQKAYYVNGILTPYVDGVNNAQKIANELGERVNHVYSYSGIQMKSEYPATAEDALEALVNHNFNGELTNSGLTLASGITVDLMSGKEVVVFAHSGGAGITYNMTTHVSDFLTNVGMQDKLNNLTVVTLGGYSPPSNQWHPNVKVESHINSGDIVPELWYKPLNVYKYNKEDIESFHTFKNYIKYIRRYRKN